MVPAALEQDRVTLVCKDLGRFKIKRGGGSNACTGHWTHEPESMGAAQRRGGVPHQDAPPAGFPPDGQLEGTFREHGFKV